MAGKSSIGQRIARPFLKLGTRAARTALRIVKSNPTLYAMLYDAANVQEFSDLFEHEKMLADAVRVDTYAAAIRQCIKPGDVVVDLGTGSGILAMLAARQGAMVYAIDHSDFIEVAEKIARHNGIENIQFVRANSKQFTCPEKVDVLLHEQIGDDLFNENMIENLLDLKRRLLKPDGLILPGKFELYIEPVSLKPAFRVPYIWEIRPQGLNLDLMRDLPEAVAYQSTKYHRRPMENAGIDTFLSDPQPLITVDLNTITDADHLPTTYHATRHIVRSGQMDGLFQYFRVIFDDQIAFDTHPASTKTHWGNRLFRVPQRQLSAGEMIGYTLSMGNIAHSHTWEVSLHSPTHQPTASATAKV